MKKRKRNEIESTLREYDVKEKSWKAGNERN